MTDILGDLDWRGLYADCTDREALARRLAEGPHHPLRRFRSDGRQPARRQSRAAVCAAAFSAGRPPSDRARRRCDGHDWRSVGQIARAQPADARAAHRDTSSASAAARAVSRLLGRGQSGAAGQQLRLDGARVDPRFPARRRQARHRERDGREGFRPRADGGSSTRHQLSPSSATCCSRPSISITCAKSFDCELQVGGTDQWGNITIGAELTRKKLGATVWGLVFPLITQADGSKFGKTASGTVWLDPDKTSPYRFYQFFMNTADSDVRRPAQDADVPPGRRDRRRSRRHEGADLNRAPRSARSRAR